MTIDCNNFHILKTQELIPFNKKMQKTSLIKALAHQTGRSIVNVPLAKISTNTELQSVFFNKQYYIRGEYLPDKVSVNENMPVGLRLETRQFH